jgi:two-component system, OmpR family, alkaline phosphatase synthesis response regulator PhoP
MKTKILLADDEKDIVEFIKYNLELENYQVITAFDGEEALKKMSQHPDLVILDIMMPKLSGYDVCKRIRAEKEYQFVPIIFLTAKSSEIDEILGLELGANDYIRKPISPQKLVARVKSNLRKAVAEDIHKLITGEEVYQAHGLVIDVQKHSIKINTKEKIFPKKEFEILLFLIQHPGRVFSREALLQNVWGTDVVIVERTVDVHIRKIREKLDDLADIIETIKGVGYRFKEY